MPKSIKSSLDLERLPPVDERHSYRPIGNWVRGYRNVLVSQEPYIGLTTPTDRPLGSYQERFAEDLLTDWRRDFALREVIDLRHECSRVVNAINRKARPHVIAKAKRAFLAGLERNNLCFKCRYPIKTEKHLDLEIKELRYKRTNPRFNGSGRDFSFAPWALPRRRYRLVGNIPAHFEWRWDENGKAYYCFVDGTMRDIRLMRFPYQVVRSATRWEKRKGEADENGNKTVTRFKEKFVEMMPDGTFTDVVPNPVYQIKDRKCECKHRRPKERRIVLV